VPRYILPDAHLSPQPINRGPWALRTARIRCEFHESSEKLSIPLKPFYKCVVL